MFQHSDEREPYQSPFNYVLFAHEYVKVKYNAEVVFVRMFHLWNFFKVVIETCHLGCTLTAIRWK
jgi:hypothetical protein